MIGPGPRDEERPRRPRRPRRRLLVLVLATVGLAGVLMAPSLVVGLQVADRLHDDPATAPSAPVAIVLGAGLDGSGRPSPFLAERIAVGVRLYTSGRVKALLMSGDNSRTGYDEVGAMAVQAQRLGVPATAIVQDHAGFDTYSSCYRARSVWGVTHALVVTQPFHLTRAVWLCRQLGVSADGVATAQDDTDATWRGWLRELPAVDKSLLDVVRDRSPTFPGPREHTLDAVTAAG